MKKQIFLFFAILSAGLSIAQPTPIGKTNLKEQFKTPPFEYRAFAPFQGAGGAKYLETESTIKQLDNIFNNYGYGGIMIAPTDDKPFLGKQFGVPSYMRHVGNGLQKTLPSGASPWLMTLPKGGTPYRGEPSESTPNGLKPYPLPAYLSEAYYKNLKEILDYSKQNGRKVIFYDEIGYPSGISNHATPEKYRRKVLEKMEETVTGSQNFKKTVTSSGEIMAIVAMNSVSGKRIDLTPMVKNNQLIWEVPKGNWKLMQFNCIAAKASGGELDYPTATDYLDPDAVNWFVDKVYEPNAKAMGEHLGSTVFQTFFDDVGIFDEERTWTAKFNEKFKARFGVNPAIYYPALWENIGTETNAVRVAFFETRAELLADGFPKLVTDWGKKNKVQVSGHCPGNYDPQPVDMNGVTRSSFIVPKIYRW
jgi:alpha-L-rhamnosidase